MLKLSNVPRRRLAQPFLTLQLALDHLFAARSEPAV
jgi:hypothetical protein